MEKKHYIILILTILLGFSANAQRTVSGTVKSSVDGQTIAGAVIQLVGTTIGTKTNSDGDFKLSIPQNLSNNNSKLKITYVGFKTKIIAASSDNISISLDEDKLKIDEVVVTAIGIKKEKKSIGYSSQEVKSEELTKAAQGDVFKSMDGKVAGLQVTQASGVAGAGSNIRLRGPVSINGSNQPLMVVDGIIIDNSQNFSGNPDDGNNNLLGSNGGVSYSNRGIDLNPEDIESVNVLKGASAAALYGSDASNGAIIITTKKGKSRTDNKKGISVTYNTSFALDVINQKAPLQNKYSQGSAGKYADPATSTGSGSWGALVDTLYYIQDPTYTWSKYGRIVGASNTTTGKTKVNPFDQYDFFNVGWTIDNSISMTGGNEKNQFRFSVADRNQKGIMPNNYYNRVNLSFGANSQISEKFNMSYTLNYVNSEDNKLQQGSNTSGVMLGLLRTPITFDNANGASDPNDESQGAYIFANGTQRAYRRNAAYDNPYWTANKNFYRGYLDRVYGNVQANWDLNSFITLTARFGGDVYTDRRQQYIDINSAALSTGSYRNDNYFSRILTGDVFITMPFKLRNNWNSSFVIGANIYDNYYQQVYAEGNNLLSPNFANMANASTYITKDIYGQHRKYSGYGVARFDWNNVVFLEGTLRMDRTSTLAKEFNTYLYPSLNLGYVFSEDMNLNPKFLSYGKVRTSFAMVGKDAPAYVTKTYYNAGSTIDPWASGVQFPFNGVGGFQSSTSLGNSRLQNEYTYSYEIGTELKFFENRVGVDLTQYYNVSTNQIIPVSVSPSSGYTSQYLNAGKIQNWGLEAMLNITPVKTKSFKWDVMVNWSMNRSKVLSLYPGLTNLGMGGFASTDIQQVVGQQYGVLYGTDWLRDASGNVVIDDDQSSTTYGKPLADVKPTVIGNPNPNFLMGFGNTFTYKRLSLNVLLSWKNGGQLWNGTRGALVTMGTAKETEARGTETVFTGVLGHLDANNNIVHYDASLNEVSGAGAVNTISTALNQAWYQGNGGGFGAVSSQFVENADFLKLREIALNFSFDTKKWKTVKAFDVGFFARNIILWTPYTGIDPEQSLTGASNLQGLDYFNMPGICSFGIKAKASF